MDIHWIYIQLYIHSVSNIIFSDINGEVDFSYDPCEDCEGYLSGEQPVSFALSQNYPNPFNPITTIEFTLEKNENIKLNIYDINGRIVKTLLSGFTLSGSYSIKWDAKDYKGNDMPSGIYIYQLISSTQQISNKMILLR